MEKIEFWLRWLMIATALAGTIWYVWVELSNNNSLNTVGWSVVAGVWFIVLRRLLRRKRP